MKTKTRNILAGAAVAVLLGGAFGGIATLGNHKAVAEGQESALDLLNGFTCPGASVYIAGAGESIAKQMRFVLNLDAAQAAYADEAHTAGVVVLPYDLYRKNNLSELTKDNKIASKVDVKWEKQENGSYTSYAYLDATLIPAGQENRTLVARGYIEDGTNVYYTEEVKASMAYVAWKNIGMQGGAYDTQLKEYMGEYTLTYGAGENEKIGGLYYGDKFDTKLPETVGGVAVEKWYWDEAKTQEILTTDYATGSMTIYYELEKFAVTGTISCADGIDLTKVKVYANGEDTGATVSESGSFSVQLPAGKHDFVFETEGYIAYADGVEVSATTEAINATLKKNTYAIGNYGALKSNTNPTFNENGTYTVSGQNQMIIFPHTATTDAFEYYVKVSDINRNSQHEAGVGICLTDGKNKLTVSCWAWGQIQVSMGAGSEENYNQFFYKHNDLNTWDGVTFKFVVDKVNAQILLYINNNLRFTFTKNAITPNVVELEKSYGDSLTAVYAEKIAGFFADGAKIAAGINGGFKNPSTATYTCSIAKLYAVSGTISPVDGVDLTATTLTVDGISTPISVQGNGSYSVLIAEGKHTLVFANGKYGATVTKTVTTGETAIGVTALTDYTYAIGNYKNFKSVGGTYDAEEALNGSLKISGSGIYALVMPNTATAKAQEYNIHTSDKDFYAEDEGLANEQFYGFGLCNGTQMISFTFNRWQFVRVNIGTTAGTGEQKVFSYGTDPYGGFGGREKDYKIVRTSESIQLYVNNVLMLTVTKDGITASLSTTGYPDSLTTDSLAGFFGENVELAFGLVSTGSEAPRMGGTYAYSMRDIQSAE